MTKFLPSMAKVMFSQRHVLKHVLLFSLVIFQQKDSEVDLIIKFNSFTDFVIFRLFHIWCDDVHRRLTLRISCRDSFT